MSYSLPSPPRTHLLLGAGYTYGVGCGVGPFFGVGVALTPRLSFGAGMGAGAFCGVGFGAGVFASCGTGNVRGLEQPVFYMPRLGFLERDKRGKNPAWEFAKRVCNGMVKELRELRRIGGAG